MKTYFLFLKVTLSISLIVLSIAAPVNHQLAANAGQGSPRFADGVPLPPPPTQPSPKLNIVQTADGVPLPPPTPPSPKNIAVLTADGVPLPPPIPPKLATVQIADGVPLPPPTPPSPKLLVS